MKLNMLKIIKKFFIVSVFLSLFISINFCYADDKNLKDAFDIGGPLQQVAGEKGAGYNIGEAKAEDMISLIITTVLTFVGVIFLVLAIYGGYIWMMARGNEQEVEKAKNTLTAAVIGLVIVIAAYAISYYVINALGGAALKAPTSDEAAADAAAK